MFRILTLSLLSIFITACTNTSTLKPFSSDGCSLFPDSSLINEQDWTNCCVTHDIAYWKGGTYEQRKFADEALKQCVLEETQDKAFADLMYQGVRAGGSPYFYNWYRWSYGWDYDRKYQALSKAEIELANRLITEYITSTTKETSND